MRVLATPAGAGTFQGGGVLVGRKVANTAFLKALLRHAELDRVDLYLGERAEEAGTRALFEGTDGEERLRLRHLVELPQALAAGEVSLLHNGSHLDRFGDLLWLRDAHARANVPVTGQIHTLSYPRSTNDYLRFLCLPPRRSDAIFCSSDHGRQALENALEGLRGSLAQREIPFPPLACELPVVPLGVDTEALSGGDGRRLRDELGIPQDAVVVLVLARFSEYDKLDLFPLLTAFRDAVLRMGTVPDARPLALLLAGARQGTKTPEMVELWARALRIDDCVARLVDFPEERKRDVLAAADLFVSPADNPQETFGITVVEAMAAGLPVVVSDYDGYRETVTEETGIAVPTRWHVPDPALSDLGPLLYERPLHLLLGQSLEVDREALTSAICELALDADGRERMGRAARARAREHYDWRALVPRYETVWRRLEATPFERPRSGRHPLALDFAGTFGHYTSAREDNSSATVLRRSELARRTPSYPIYPELQPLFDEELVGRALELAGDGRPQAELTAALAAAEPERPAWHLRALLGWLRKHGLVVEV